MELSRLFSSPASVRSLTLRSTGLGLVIALFVIACSGSDPNGAFNGSSSSSGSSGSTTPTNVSAKKEQTNDRCPSSPRDLLGSKAAGESCSTYEDCAPTCCNCSKGENQFLASACVDGVCAARTTLCPLTETESFCGEGNTASSSSSSSSGGTSSSSSSSGGTSSSSSSSSSSGSSGTTMCVAGTASSCYGTDMTWTGTQCCIKGYSQCVSGTASSCYGTDLEWTGSQCCVKPAGICTSGTASSCYGSKMEWTGVQCCVQGVAQCTGGTASSCYGTGKHWTGTQCCLE